MAHSTQSPVSEEYPSAMNTISSLIFQPINGYKPTKEVNIVRHINVLTKKDGIMYLNKFIIHELNSVGLYCYKTYNRYRENKKELLKIVCLSPPFQPPKIFNTPCPLFNIRCL